MFRLPYFLFKKFANFPTLRVCPESADVHLPGADRPDWVDHNGHKGLLELLVDGLGVHVDSGQPAAVAGMRVVPADNLGKIILA